MVTKMDYKESTEYVLSIPLFADKLGTDCLNQILDRLGHPERSYPVIHRRNQRERLYLCVFVINAAGGGIPGWDVYLPAFDQDQ